MRGSLNKVIAFKCKRCTGNTAPQVGGPGLSVDIGDGSLEMVDIFRYLRDIISAVGVMEESTAAWNRSGWRKLI